MEIGKQFKIEADELNVILSKKIQRTSKDGREYEAWKVMGYFATPENALAELVNLRVRETGLKDLQTVVKEINNLHGIVYNLLPQCLQGVRKPVKATR